MDKRREKNKNKKKREKTIHLQQEGSSCPNGIGPWVGTGQTLHDPFRTKKHDREYQQKQTTLRNTANNDNTYTGGRESTFRFKILVSLAKLRSSIDFVAVFFFWWKRRCGARNFFPKPGMREQSD
ncbi:unnamed protein product, partial [Ectocarpus sp. 6 AP-2014]